MTQSYRGRELEGSVGVDSERGLEVDVEELVFVGAAVGAEDAELGVVLRLLGHVPDAETANVVVAAGRDQHRVEVAQADRAVVLEHLAGLRVLGRVVVPHLYVSLIHLCLNPHFVAFTDLSLLDGLVHPAPLGSLLLLNPVEVVAKTTVSMIDKDGCD